MIHNRTRFTYERRATLPKSINMAISLIHVLSSVAHYGRELRNSTPIHRVTAIKSRNT